MARTPRIGFAFRARSPARAVAAAALSAALLLAGIATLLALPVILLGDTLDAHEAEHAISLRLAFLLPPPLPVRTRRRGAPSRASGRGERPR